MWGRDIWGGNPEQLTTGVDDGATPVQITERRLAQRNTIYCGRQDLVSLPGHGRFAGGSVKGFGQNISS